MYKVTVKPNVRGLLNYAKAGKQAVGEIKKAVRTVLNLGRKTARQQISSQFGTRTGFLRRQSRKMQTSVTVKSYEISGRVSPIPRLMNIYERGATLARGRGYLHPRPVVGPAAQAMEPAAVRVLTAVINKVGT